MQRSGVTSKTKAFSGISDKLRDDSDNRNNDNDRSKEDRSYGYPGGPRYENMEKSIRAREEQMREDFAAPYYDEDFNRPVGRDRFNEYAGSRHQANPDELRYGNRNEEEYYYRYRQPNMRRRDANIEDNDYRKAYQSDYGQYRGEDERDFQNRSSRGDGKARFSRGAYNPYGEHPASRGAEEYLGSNKRHPGLGGYDEDGDYYQRDYRARDDYYSNERYNEREDRRNDHRHDADLEYNDYMNRGQYEEPFHGRETYDPAREDYRRDYRDPYIRDEYRHEGYQSFGNTEGFGARGGRQHGNDWRDEDEYRYGHAPRKRGFGKYGSR